MHHAVHYHFIDQLSCKTLFLHSHISSCSYSFQHLLTPSSGSLPPTVPIVDGVQILEEGAYNTKTLRNRN